eukprot:scaffold31116_cov34-Tisochrysis_lutea.AAC.2
MGLATRQGQLRGEGLAADQINRHSRCGRGPRRRVEHNEVKFPAKSRFRDAESIILKQVRRPDCPPPPPASALLSAMSLRTATSEAVAASAVWRGLQPSKCAEGRDRVGACARIPPVPNDEVVEQGIASANLKCRFGEVDIENFTCTSD